MTKLIPLAPLLGSSPARVETAHSLLTAFRISGFLYLNDYSSLIPSELIRRVFDSSAHFFARSQSEKDDLAWTTPRSNRGYVCMGREKVSSGATKEEVAKDRESGGQDLKESFEIGREGEVDFPNQWPHSDEESMKFRKTMQDFFLRCRQLHAVLMRGIAIDMGLEETFFDHFTQRGDNTLRLLHYPAVPAGGFEGGKRVRAGAHSDFGSLTLLFQDKRGGLQVERPERDGVWLDVEPKEDTIVINAGDLLARWSNDMIRSTKHRVVEPPRRGTEKDGGHPPRYSVAYFCNPDFNEWIEVLPGTWEGERGGKKYGGINSGEYLVQRLTATY